MARFLAWVLVAVMAGVALYSYMEMGSMSDELRRLESRQEQLEQNNDRLRESRNRADSAAKAVEDSLKEVIQSANERRRAAVSRASDAERRLRAVAPDSLVDDLTEAHAQEVAALETEIAVKDRRIELLEGRLGARDSLIISLETALENETELSNYWKSEARPGFLGRFTKNAEVVAVTAGVTAVVVRFLGG